MLVDVWVCRKAKMAATDRKWIGNYVYISVCIHDGNEIPTATPMFPGSDNRYRQLEMLS